MYHIKQGLYFEQGPDGSVTIHIFRDDAANSDKLMAIGLTTDEWQSVIAEMTPPRSIVEPFEIPEEQDEVQIVQPVSHKSTPKKAAKKTTHR